MLPVGTTCCSQAWRTRLYRSGGPPHARCPVLLPRPNVERVRPDDGDAVRGIPEEAVFFISDDNYAVYRVDSTCRQIVARLALKL